MAALLATNVVGVVLFGALYVMAGVGLMPQGAFLVCLPIIFTLVTVLWVRVEVRHRGLAVLRRIGKAAAALAAVVIGTPILVLMPAFWLDQQLPADAGFSHHLGPIMALTLIALGLVLLANVVGGVVAVVRGRLAAPRP